MTTTVHETITNSKDQLDKLLSNRYIEDSLLLGSLSFTQNKLSNFIFQDLSLNLDQQSEQVDLDYNSNELLDRLWLDFHYPVIKYFQSHFKSFKKHNKAKPVEMRRLFDNFHKFIKTFSDFYSQLIQKLLTLYDLKKFIPVKILYEKFDITNDETQLELELQSLASSIVYLIYKSILSMADLSRYRSMVARDFLPPKSITKRDSDFSVSVDLYKLCILILPSFGDPYDHIAIIDNSRNDQFNVAYNFLRSSMTRIPSNLGLGNLIKLSTLTPAENTILKEYKRINTIDDPNKINTLELIKLQFLCLFNYYFLPQYWKSKDGILINGVPVKDLESAFFDNLENCNFKGKPVYSEILFKQLLILMGGLHVLTDKVGNFENDNLIKDSKIIGVYLKFFFKFLKQTFEIILNNWREYANDSLELPLLPVFRVILNWLKVCKLGYQYLRHNTAVLYKLCEVLNFEYTFMKSHENEIANALFESNPDFTNEDLASIITTKFKRARFFKEDISLKEFVPIGNHLSDFQDSYMFSSSEENSLRLIGKLTPNEFENHHSSRIVENSSRLLATGRLGKMLVTTSIKNSGIGLKFNSKQCIFEMDETVTKTATPPKKETPKPVKNKKKTTILKPNPKQNGKADIDDSDDDIQRRVTQQKPLPKAALEKTLERIQQTIEQYQQQHNQGDDILSLIKKSHGDISSSTLSPHFENDKPMIEEKKSFTPADEADDEKSYSNMVSSLLLENEEGQISTVPDIRQVPHQSNLGQVATGNNFWLTPSAAATQYQQFPLFNQFQSPPPQQQLQQQQFQPFQVVDHNQRQFFGQGSFNLLPPLPPLQQQNVYLQYFGEAPPPMPPIQQNYHQYPQFYNPQLQSDEIQQQQQQTQQIQHQPPPQSQELHQANNLYSQYGHFGH